MRILIGNDEDDSIVVNRDVRAWTHRILWFAQDGDLIILPCEPNRTFLGHVASLTGLDVSSLKFHVVPNDRPYLQIFDNLGLCEKTFLEAINRDLANVSEVVALWPSPQVSRFAERLGLSEHWSGAEFFAQHGAEVSNSKANFRAFAAGCGIPIPRGAVCHSIDEAVAASSYVLESAEALMVKMVHRGGGAGNQLIARDSTLAWDHAGARSMHSLQPSENALLDYWEAHWDWATAGGRFAVVVEEFVPEARSVYAEYFCNDSSTELGEMGELIYEGGALTKELVPLRNLPSDSIHQLAEHGQAIADYYRMLGYRGHVSADAVVAPDGIVAFVEVNARFTGSTHLYEVVAHKLIGTDRLPERTIMQCISPSTWSVPDIEQFLDVLNDLRLNFSTETGKGVIAVTPEIETVDGGRINYCVVYERADEGDEILTALNSRFGRASTVSSRDDRRGKRN